MVRVERVRSAEELRGCAKELAEVLVESVADGASVGFLAGLDLDTAARWWESLAPGVAGERALLWVARDGGRLVGTVQLHLAPMPNGRHRADIAKMLVRPDARRRGAARALLAAAEEAALAAGRTLLVLDTETGSDAEHLYRSAGWTAAGSIPGYATDPQGVPRATTYYYKNLG
ncbi:GNAT family N-acetyltransferase [Streptomyces sp. YIM 98790]|uniref:GNAT family N-acetyltransferase n=1 Tax=Streptomyces sp. YIM 98790 TaxID=2689077 RepID=UPI00140B0F2F|nr:GNAT family N-acetyltransferase [Streptomyces sp. YIM 98790]